MHKVVINAETIAASGTFTSQGIAIPEVHSHFSLYWEVTGDGTAKFEYESSPDGEHYVLDDGTAIATGRVKNDGPVSDGIDMVDFSPLPCEALKIKCTETGTASSITITAVLCTT